MRFYNRQHQYYCGIDLHVKTMFVCILDAAGQVLVHRNVPSTPAACLEVVALYRADLVVAAECMFTWYWLADLCAAEGVAFVLGHAVAMKAIHGGKAKNDKIDSHKIAVLLRGGMLPQAYVYPAAMRPTRDLLRRRLHLVRKRGPLLVHIQHTRAQYNLPEFGRRLAYPANRDGVPEHVADPRDGFEPMERVAVMALGVAHNRELQVGDERIVMGDEREVDFDALVDARIGEVLTHSLAIRCVRQTLLERRQVVLRARVLDVGQQFAALADQVQTPAEQVARRSHRCRIDVRLGQHPAAQQDGDLVRVDLVVLGFAAVNRLHG